MRAASHRPARGTSCVCSLTHSWCLLETLRPRNSVPALLINVAAHLTGEDLGLKSWHFTTIALTKIMIAF